MKYLITTIAAVVLVGCGESQQSATKPEPKQEPPTAKDTDYTGMYTLSVPEKVGDLIVELKPDGSFLGKTSREAGDNLIGSWKVEDELLVCEGTSEKSSQRVIVKFNKTTGKLNSISRAGEEMPIKDLIPEGEDGLYLKKNSTPPSDAKPELKSSKPTDDSGNYIMSEPGTQGGVFSLT